VEYDVAGMIDSAVRPAPGIMYWAQSQLLSRLRPIPSSTIAHGHVNNARHIIGRRLTQEMRVYSVVDDVVDVVVDEASMTW